MDVLRSYHDRQIVGNGWGNTSGDFHGRDYCREPDASYTVYLVHLIIVISIGIVLTRYNVNWLIGLPILIIITACVTLAIHVFVIRRSHAASMLYNGKTIRHV